ncbi:MAG TPA: DUF1553 domain-containing protein, partial [Gemmataceae bacterium]|nr:DUF1553 domain-containing protein [Gemmataceae bacterium]
ASTSRLFLGLKLECAQCHNHPTAHWTRKQFWEFAAFFADLGTEGKANRQQLTIPGTKQVVQARFVTGVAPQLQPGGSPRATLAEWITAADNPYFARAAVNQLWAYFFGAGLVEPADDMGEHNPPSHPELLDELARQFTAHRFDLKFLIRALVASRAYQLSSALPLKPNPSPLAGEGRSLLARMAVRGLSPEQLFDSLAVAIDWQEPPPRAQRSFVGQEDRSPRAQFLEKFANQDKRTESQTTILQALFLMNGKLMADATSLEGSGTLAIIADAESLSTARRLETLYLVALARKPRAEEAARLIKYIDAGGPRKDKKKAFADVFWALLNSAEFRLNH